VATYMRHHHPLLPSTVCPTMRVRGLPAGVLQQAPAGCSGGLGQRRCPPLGMERLLCRCDGDWPQYEGGAGPVSRVRHVLALVMPHVTARKELGGAVYGRSCSMCTQIWALLDGLTPMGQLPIGSKCSHGFVYAMLVQRPPVLYDLTG